MMENLKEVDYRNSPIVWFSTMEIEANRGNFEAAARAKRELERLGVFVRFKGKVQRQYRKAEKMFDNNKDKLLRRCLDSLDWLIEDVKWRFDEVKNEGCSVITNEGGYSPELTEAMEIRDEVVQHFEAI